jgi:hypothetical protein
MQPEGVPFRCHSCEATCADLDVEHRLTKPVHPSTNGQIERMNRTIKNATVQRYHDNDPAQLERHPADFIVAYIFGRRLKTLKGLTSLRVHLQALGRRASQVQSQPAPRDAGLTTTRVMKYAPFLGMASGWLGAFRSIACPFGPAPPSTLIFHSLDRPPPTARPSQSTCP